MLDLVEDSHCEDVFDKFLEFLYTAKIEVDCDSAVGILCLADKYNTNALKRLVVDYMVEMSRSPQVGRIQNARFCHSNSNTFYKLQGNCCLVAIFPASKQSPLS